MPAPFALRSLLVYEELAGTANFAVDHSGTPGDFLPVPAQPDSINIDPQRASIETNVSQQYKHAKSERVHGPRAITLGFSLPLHGSGLAGDTLVASATSSTNALMRILKCTLGGLYGGNLGSTVASAASAVAITVGVGHGARFTAGGAAARVNALGNLEIRPIKSVVGDLVTFKYGFSATPTAADIIYNATTVYLDDSGTHLQFLARGAAPTDRWSLRGMQLQSLAIENPLGELPRLTFQLQGAEWESLLSGSLAPVTYANTQYLGFNGGRLMVQPVGTVTAADIAAAEVTFTSGLSYVASHGPGGVNTVFGYTQGHSPPVVAGSFRPYYDGNGWFDAWLAKTRYASALQVGQISARGVLIEAPNVQIGPVLAPQDLGGLSGQTVSFDGDLDTDATDLTTAIRRSPLRFHFVN